MIAFKMIKSKMVNTVAIYYIVFERRNKETTTAIGKKLMFFRAHSSIVAADKSHELKFEFLSTSLVSPTRDLSLFPNIKNCLEIQRLESNKKSKFKTLLYILESVTFTDKITKLVINNNIKKKVILRPGLVNPPS